jgi:thiol-disulfide isomerase/thioredoxin
MRIPAPARRALVAAPWLLPVAVLVLSGVAKIIAPEGTPPRSLEGLTRVVSYPVLLRLLGAFEILVAVQVVRPATRRLGVVVALGRFAGFTMLVAANAHDAAFLADCGCFGGLPFPSVWSGLGPILVRNALLCGLLVAALGLPRQPSWLAWTQAVGVAALVFLGAISLAGHRLRAYDRAVQAVIRSGERVTRLPGTTLPVIDFVAADGDRTTSGKALRDNDHVMFFSPDCPHCRRLAPSWAEFDRGLKGRGARLVLLATNESSPIADFKAEYGCEALAHYVIPEPLDAYRWGVKHVPQLVVLGEGRRLAYHEGQILSGTFTASLNLASRRVGDLGRLNWERIAEALFEPGTVCPKAPARSGSLMIGSVRLPSGEERRMCVCAASGKPSYSIEFALGLERDGTIGNVVPLTLSGYARVVDPGGSLYDALRGRTLADAVKLAGQRAVEPALDAPVWGAVGLLLEALADELKTADAE